MNGARRVVAGDTKVCSKSSAHMLSSDMRLVLEGVSQLLGVKCSHSAWRIRDGAWERRRCKLSPLNEAG